MISFQIPFFYFFLLLALTWPSHSFYAQSNLDELLAKIEKMPESKAKADSLNELAFLYARNDISKIPTFANQAIAIAEKFNYKKGVGDAQVRLGIYEKANGNFEKALQHYEYGLKIRLQANDRSGVASVYNNLGICHLNLGDLNKGILQFKKGLQIIAGESAQKERAILYNSLADAYIYKENYVAALSYLDSCSSIYKERKEIPAIARLMLTSGNLQFELKNYNGAEGNYTEALKHFSSIPDNRGNAASFFALGNLFLEKKQYDLSLNSFQKALSLKETLPESELASLYYNLGRLYAAKKEPNNALGYLEKSELLFNDLDQVWELPDLYQAKGNIHFQLNQFQKAKQDFLNSLHYLDEELPSYTMANTYLNLAETYALLGQPDSALIFSQRHIALQDSLHKNLLAASNAQSNLALANQRNAALDLRLSESKRLQLLTYGILAIAILSIIILGLALINNTSKQKRKDAEYQLYLAEEEIQHANHKVDDLLKNQELEMAYAKLEAKDETQREIGQDLHDNIGALLSTVKLYFTDFTEQLNALATDNSKKQHKAVELLDEAVQEVRRISHDMQSGILHKLGLIEAVKSMAASIQESGRIQVEVKIHGFSKEIESTIEVKIYKIIQESVANVLKHAKANKLTIYLHRQDELINIIVEDNGIGFTEESIEEKTGMGLKNIAYRVSQLNGTCHFDSKEQRGTSVIIDIPLSLK